MIDPLSISIPSPVGVPTPDLPIRRLLQPSPDHPDDYVLEIDNSTLEKFTQCNRRMENYAIHSREAATDQSAQQFGRLFHLCEEKRLLHGMTDEVRLRQTELVAKHFVSHPPDVDDHRTEARMLSVLRSYNERYASDGWPERVLRDANGLPLVERPFKIPLCTIPINAVLPYHPNGLVVNYTKLGAQTLYVSSLHIIYTGRIDAILSDSNATWVVDHKTTSSGGKEFAEAFRLASQTVGYTWAAQKILAAPVSGLIVNAITILKPLKTARGNPDRETFDRLTYFYSADRIAEWEESVRHTVSDFVACLVRGFFPMTGPKSFKSPCVYCDYHENCQLPRDQRAADLASSLFRDVTWNPITPD